MFSLFFLPKFFFVVLYLTQRSISIRSHYVFAMFFLIFENEIKKGLEVSHIKNLVLVFSIFYFLIFAFCGNHWRPYQISSAKKCE